MAPLGWRVDEPPRLLLNAVPPSMKLGRRAGVSLDTSGALHVNRNKEPPPAPFLYFPPRSNNINIPKPPWSGIQFTCRYPSLVRWLAIKFIRNQSRESYSRNGQIVVNRTALIGTNQRPSISRTAMLRWRFIAIPVTEGLQALNLFLFYLGGGNSSDNTDPRREY